MKLIRCDKIGVNSYEMEISVPKDDFFKEIDRVYKKKVSTINIPGFRKGKAPRSVIEKRYGNRIFWDDAINNLCPVAYEKAVEQAGLEVVNTNKCDVISVDIDNGLTFKVECEVYPEVEISQYKNLNVDKYIKLVTDEDVDNEIKAIRDSYARTIDITDREARMGDEVVIDFEGKVGDVAFDGGKGNNYNLKLGSNQFIPGFESKIVGHKVGEEFDIDVTFPEDYHSKDLAGKDAVFSIVLHEIREIEIPDLDDEFVKDISQFDNVESFKEDIRNTIKDNKDKQSDIEVENQLIEKIVSSVKAEIPSIMIKRKIDDLQHDFESKLSKQGLKFVDYLEYIKQTLEDFRKGLEQEAEKRVKFTLALRKISEIENFVVSQDEIDNCIKEMKKLYKLSEDKFEKIFSKDKIIENIKMEKALNLIKDTAQIKEIIETKK